MVDYVASQTVSLDDQVTAGANAAAAALDKLANSADGAASSTDTASAASVRAATSWAAAVRASDPATKAAYDLAKAQAQLASVTADASARMAAGTTTQAQADAVTATYTGRVRAAQAAVDQLSASNDQAAKTAAGMTDANLEAANAANTAGAAHAGFYREIVILGHEVVSGNFNRIPGSLLVLAERSGNLDTIFQKVVATVTSLPGILTLAGAAGVAAIGYIGVEASNAIARQIDLQNSLRATRDDYISLATEVSAAGRAAAHATPGLSTTDATAAGGILAASPDFSGTQQQLTNLIELAANMAAVFKETADKAATDLAAAMEAPGAAAEKLVGHLRGMNQELANSISLQADAGDKAGAFARYEDVLSKAVDGAANKLSPLASALHDISEAFNGSDQAGQGFGHTIADFCIGAVYSLLEALNGLLLGMNKIFDLARAAKGAIVSDVTGDVASTIRA